MTDQSGASRSADARRRGKLQEKSISDAYPEIDNDLARDNLENDIPAADLEDLCPTHGAAAVPAADALHNKTSRVPPFRGTRLLHCPKFSIFSVFCRKTFPKGHYSVL